MPFPLLALAPLLSGAGSFFKNYWKYVLIVLAVVCLFFYIKHLIKEHDEGIVKVCNAGWEKTIADANQKNLENLQTVRKRNDQIRSHSRPAGADALIDILQRGQFTESQP